MFAEKYNPLFQEELEISKGPVAFVANWLREHGDDVINWSEKLTVAKDYTQYRDHQDNGDIWWRVGYGGVWHRLEVKHRPDLKFTCAEEWPHFFKPGPLVCAVHAWDKADPKIWGIMSLNSPMTHFLFIRPETRRYWTKVEIWDKRFQCKQWTYVCPTERVTFHPISLEKPDE